MQLGPRSAEAIADLIQRLEAVLICFQRASGGVWRAFRQSEEIFRLDAVDPERARFVFRITPEGWIDAQFRLPLGGSISPDLCRGSSSAGSSFCWRP